VADLKRWFYPEIAGKLVSVAPGHVAGAEGPEFERGVDAGINPGSSTVACGGYPRLRKEKYSDHWSAQLKLRPFKEYLFERCSKQF
jgi:hypothetical protein